VQAAQVTPGRTFAVRFDHGEDFYTALNDFCRTHNIRQGFIPMFIAGLRNVELVGSCERIEDPEAPVWTSVHLKYVEALGGGTLRGSDPDGQLLDHRPNRSDTFRAVATEVGGARKPLVGARSRQSPFEGRRQRCVAGLTTVLLRRSRTRDRGRCAIRDGRCRRSTD
jgi:hypothetical protein